MKKQREVWYDGRGVSVENMDVWEVINHSPIEKVLVTLDQRQEGYFPQKMKFITQVQEASDLDSVSSKTLFSQNDELILAEAKRLGFKTCIFYSVDNREMLERCLKRSKSV